MRGRVVSGQVQPLRHVSNRSPNGRCHEPPHTCVGNVNYLCGVRRRLCWSNGIVRYAYDDAIWWLTRLSHEHGPFSLPGAFRY